MNAVPAIILRDVHKSFGATKIIDGVSLQIGRGERHGLIGPNGAGKTTLFNMISGRLPVSRGQIELNGRPIQNREPHEINHMGLCRSFQITSLFHRLSVFENVRCALLWSLGYRYSVTHLLSRQRKLNAATQILLERLGLWDRREIRAGLLSYAEQRALEIGITVAGGADVILLDEPTAGMNRNEADRAVSLIRQLTEGKTLLVVEHDMNVVFSLADNVSVLVYGRIIASDVPERVRMDPAVREAYLGTKAPDARNH
jgi:branched-chain amino acid transport system ATP-binding protein